MSKAGVIGAVVIIVGAAGGGGYYYMSHKAEQELHNVIASIEKSVPGSSIKYESSSVNPLSQSATLHKVVAKDGKGREYTAETLTVGGFSQNKISDLSVDKFHTMINDGTIDIDHVDAKNIAAGDGAIVLEDGQIKKIVPSKFSFDLLNVEKLSAMGPDKTGATVAQYQVKNYGLKRDSDQTLKQLDIKGTEDGKEYLKLNQAEIDGLDLAQISALVEQGEMPKAIPGQPKKAVIEGVDIHMSGQEWALAKFETDNSKAANGDLKSSAVFSGLNISTAHNIKLYPLKQMGYDHLDASGNVIANFDKAKQLWTVTPFNLVIKDLGTLNADLKFNGPQDVSSPKPQELLSDYKLISLKVTLQNQGLMQKIFESAANKQNTSAGSAISSDKPVSVDQVKENMINMIKKDAETAIIPIQKQGDEAIIEVMNDPKKSLVIEMNPAAPVTAMELMGKSQLEMLDTLKLNIKAESAK